VSLQEFLTTKGGSITNSISSTETKTRGAILYRRGMKTEGNGGREGTVQAQCQGCGIKRKTDICKTETLFEEEDGQVFVRKGDELEFNKRGYPHLAKFNTRAKKIESARINPLFSRVTTENEVSSWGKDQTPWV